MLEESVTSSVPSLWATMNSWFTPSVLFVVLNLMIGTIAITSSFGSRNSPEQPDHDHDHDHDKSHDSPQPLNLARSPSVLQRLKSINFYTHRSREPSTEIHTHYDETPSVLQRLKSINLYSYLSPEPSSAVSPSENNASRDVGAQTRLSFEETHEAEEVQEQESSGEEEEDKELQDQFEGQSSFDEIYSQLKSHQVARTKSDTKPTLGEIPTKLPQKMKKSASLKSAFAHFDEEDIIQARRPATMKEGKPRMNELLDEEEVDAKADDFINRFKQQLQLQRLDSIMRYKDTVSKGSSR